MLPISRYFFFLSLFSLIFFGFFFHFIFFLFPFFLILLLIYECVCSMIIKRLICLSKPTSISLDILVTPNYVFKEPIRKKKKHSHRSIYNTVNILESDILRFGFDPPITDPQIESTWQQYRFGFSIGCFLCFMLFT